VLDTKGNASSSELEVLLDCSLKRALRKVTFFSCLSFLTVCSDTFSKHISKPEFYLCQEKSHWRLVAYNLIRRLTSECLSCSFVWGHGCVCEYTGIFCHCNLGDFNFITGREFLVRNFLPSHSFCVATFQNSLEWNLCALSTVKHLDKSK